MSRTTVRGTTTTSHTVFGVMGGFVVIVVVVGGGGGGGAGNGICVFEIVGRFSVGQIDDMGGL